VSVECEWSVSVSVRCIQVFTHTHTHMGKRGQDANTCAYICHCTIHSGGPEPYLHIKSCILWSFTDPQRATHARSTLENTLRELTATHCDVEFSMESRNRRYAAQEPQKHSLRVIEIDQKFSPTVYRMPPLPECGVPKKMCFSYKGPNYR
jgi:hypothetical protein